MTYAFENNRSKSDLATVATSGSYNDLTDTPDLATVATSGSYDDLTNTPDLAIVATSGSYDDLTNTPNLAVIATSGSYNDLLNKPEDLLVIECTTATLSTMRGVFNYSLDVSSLISDPNDWAIISVYQIGLDGSGSAFTSNEPIWRSSINTKQQDNALTDAYLYGSANRFGVDRSTNKVYIKGIIYQDWDNPNGKIKIRIVLARVTTNQIHPLATDQLTLTQRS